jgi:hypothetical protein
VTISSKVKTIGDYAFGFRTAANQRGKIPIMGQDEDYLPAEWGLENVYYEKVKDFIMVVEQGSAAEEYAKKFDIPYTHRFDTKELEDGTVEITKYNGTETKLDIPDELFGKKVSGIGSGAFAVNKNLTEVKVPFGITYIGSAAFSECSSLQHISLPKSLKTIGDDAFTDCTALDFFEVPLGVEKIGARL